MAVSFITSASGADLDGEVAISCPATQANDIIICSVTSRSTLGVSSSPSISPSTGWTIYEQEALGSGGVTGYAFLAWKRSAGGSEGTFTISDGDAASTGIVANLSIWRGCKVSGSPINASVLTVNASSSTCTAATITSTVDGCLLLFTMHDLDNGTSSAQSSANLGSMTERWDNASTQGDDEAVSGATVAQASQGASGASTGTLSVGPDVNAGGNTFLEPEPDAATKRFLSLGVGN